MSHMQFVNGRYPQFQDLFPGILERIGQLVASMKQRHSIRLREANWVLAHELQDILRE
jgi:hypothetical protein